MAALKQFENTAGIPEALIVEDSLAQAQIISRMIEAQGWACRHCPTLREAYDVLNARKSHGRAIQALFLDVFVGAYDALAHVTRMKTFTGGAPLILMTAGASHEATETTLGRARQTAADFVLRKPFKPDHIGQIFEACFAIPDQAVPRKHIVVIDGNAGIRSHIRRILEAGGYRVSDFADVDNAVERVDMAHADLVLCEVIMRGTGGLRGMHHIKQTFPHIQVVAMSAGLEGRISGSRALSMSRQMGIDAQLPKPFGDDDLTELIRLMLADTSFLD
ncbi:response regulator [Asticcacaulis endophyticus]|uniref:Response regulatory domain-containing protein n=1 Tax=Asticcacaulis endophyticus TaxID=1395890 RepID=A0A918PWQ5_9CAUL|nr:response regulator [Asticcacaulis endophyticus]GGZ24489.1 hypothetical protein GCM10011273_07120 [Asticcacaulis endophyticus]